MSDYEVQHDHFVELHLAADARSDGSIVDHLHRTETKVLARGEMLGLRREGTYVVSPITRVTCNGITRNGMTRNGMTRIATHRLPVTLKDDHHVNRARMLGPWGTFTPEGLLKITGSPGGILSQSLGHNSRRSVEA
jgi:hypothetical protein